ncbi:MAG TPA: hypothetical protein VK934_10470 [Fimbriimonas sp.]|nr:hypothetical protein [Fimbriimonas sp.]
MRPLGSLAIIVIISWGCSSPTSEDRKSVPAQVSSGAEVQSTDKALLGQWVTAATSAGHYEGKLSMEADGTFKEVDTFKKDGKKDTVEGTFTLRTEADREVLTLAINRENGSPASGSLELEFKRKEEVLLQIFPGTVYARPGRQSAALKVLGMD